MKKTKTDKIKEHLIKKGFITSWEAIKLYNCTRLAAVIHSLKNKSNMPILTQPMLMKEGKSQLRYAKYIYKPVK